jgi:predicted RNA-binding protein with PUA-like domain
MAYWLMKSEPEVFSFADLKKAGATRWEGVRNYQARNLLRDSIALGDGVLFYHSSAEPPGVAGLAKVSKKGYPDPSQFERKSEYYDPDSKKDEPRWYAVDIAYDRPLGRFVSLPELRQTKGLAKMVLLNKSRLSVQPVSAEEWALIVAMASTG